MKLSLKEIAQGIGGELIGNDLEINSISTNSNEIGKNCLFIPIKGEKFDGHIFLQDACDSGAAAVLTARDDYDLSVPFIRVKDTRLALGDIARYYRKKMKNVKVIGITGSVGKTTTKDMVASVLSQKFNTLKTQGNYNNDIGVPLTIFGIDENTEVAVIEMGMNHFNEIDYLSSIALPDIGIISIIGHSHIGNLGGTRDGILKAKCEIFNHMAKDSLKILNGDDDKLITISDKYENICYCSIKGNGDIYADNIISRELKGISCDIHIKDEVIHVDIPIPGRHMVSNALYAAAAAYALGLSPVEIKKGIEEFKQTKMRWEVIEVNERTLVNDAYNASPQSVKAAVDVISECSNTKTLILGDMFELGENSPKYHSEVGAYAAKKADVIICIGELSKHTYNAVIKEGGNAFYFKTMEELFDNMNIIPLKSVILVKASRGMHFEKIIDKLRSDNNA